MGQIKSVEWMCNPKTGGQVKPLERVQAVRGCQIETNQIETNQIETNQIKSNQVKSKLIKSNRNESSRNKSKRVKSKRVKSSQVKSTLDRSPMATAATDILPRGALAPLKRENKKEAEVPFIDTYFFLI